MTDQTSASTEAAGNGTNDAGQIPPPHDLMWYERPGMANMVIVGLLVAGGLLVALAMAFHSDSTLMIKKLPGFYAVSAIASVVAAALAARMLRGLFHVGEDYYDR